MTDALMTTDQRKLIDPENRVFTVCECCGWETEAQGDLLTELMRLHDCEEYRKDQNQVEHLSQPYISVPEETLRAWLL